MTTERNRDKELLRAANIRAQITSLLNKKNDFILTSEIEKSLEEFLAKEGANNKHLGNQLKLMSDNGLIKRKQGKGRMFAYCSNQTQENKVTKVDVKIKPMKSGIVPAYKIDVVKGQKRVRITLDNVMFDIGVVDA